MHTRDGKHQDFGIGELEDASEPVRFIVVVLIIQPDWIPIGSTSADSLSFLGPENLRVPFGRVQEITQHEYMRGRHPLLQSVEASSHV